MLCTSCLKIHFMCSMRHRDERKAFSSMANGDIGALLPFEFFRQIFVIGALGYEHEGSHIMRNFNTSQSLFWRLSKQRGKLSGRYFFLCCHNNSSQEDSSKEYCKYTCAPTYLKVE